MAEILAIQESIRFARAQNVPNLIVESDYLQAINLINSEEDEFRGADCWLEEIRSLRDFFSSIVFKFCNRSYNGLTDRIAKNARNCSLNMDWFSDFPSWIVSQLRKDDHIGFAQVADK